MTKLHQLADLGQAIRYDHICRSFITSGDLQALIDEGLRGITGSSEALALQGQIAIANAKASYARFREMLSGDRWDRLAAQDAHVQRPLGASTKNPLYPNTLYVDSLIGPDTVNTAPPATLNAFRDHGTVTPTLEAGLDEARAQLAARLSERAGIVEHGLFLGFSDGRHRRQ
jgi:transaldolase/glucose-6-phosphate isomerase